MHTWIEIPVNNTLRIFILSREPYKMTCLIGLIGVLVGVLCVLIPDIAACVCCVLFAEIIFQESIFQLFFITFVIIE